MAPFKYNRVLGWPIFRKTFLFSYQLSGESVFFITITDILPALVFHSGKSYPYKKCPIYITRYICYILTLRPSYLHTASRYESGSYVQFLKISSAQFSSVSATCSTCSTCPQLCQFVSLSCQFRQKRVMFKWNSAISVFISNPTTTFHVTETLPFLFQVSFIKNVCHTYKQKFCHSRFHVKFTKNVMFNRESAISFLCQIQPQ